MAKENLKLVASSTPPRSPAREALAAAINDATKARAALEEVRAAAQQAIRKEIEVEDRIATLRENVEIPSPDAMIRALAAGKATALDLTTPEAEAHAAIEAAEREIAAWRYANEIAKAEIPVRELAVEKAAERVEAAAKDVVRSEIDVARLIEEAEKMQAAVVAQRLLLQHLDRVLPDGTERALLVEFFARQWLREEMTGSWKFSDIAKARLAAFEALKHNSDAEILIHE